MECTYIMFYGKQICCFFKWTIDQMFERSILAPLPYFVSEMVLQRKIQSLRDRPRSWRGKAGALFGPSPKRRIPWLWRGKEQPRRALRSLAELRAVRLSPQRPPDGAHDPPTRRPPPSKTHTAVTRGSRPSEKHMPPTRPSRICKAV